jgi:hypothetical protein
VDLGVETKEFSFSNKGKVEEQKKQFPLSSSKD